MISDKETIRFLVQKVDVFSTFDEEDVERIARVLVEEKYNPGEALMKEGGMERDIFIIKKGKVKISKKVDNEEKIFATLGDGELIGEMALIERLPHSASVIALTETTALKLSEDALLDLPEGRKPIIPLLILSIARKLSSRLRQANERLMRELHSTKTEEELKEKAAKFYYGESEK